MIPRRAEGEDECRGLSEGAVAVLNFLKRRGASFFTDIVRGTSKLKDEVEGALWELVEGGNPDSRRLRQPSGANQCKTAFRSERRKERGPSKYRRAVVAALSRRGGRAFESARGDLLDAVASLRHRVPRASRARDDGPKWREVLLTMRRLEDRGEIRGGRFVSGFLGEQFALPLAVESLRATRNLAPTPRDCDSFRRRPAQSGRHRRVPGNRVAANSGRTVAFRDGKAVPPSEHPDVAVLAAG